MQRVLLAVTVMASAAALTAALVPASQLLAGRLGVMDPPGPRKIHARPMPRLGGVALLGGFALIVLAGYFLLPVLSQIDWLQRVFGSALAVLREANRVQEKLLALFAGAVLVFVVGLADDVFGKDFPVWAKFAGQAAAAAVLITSGVTTSLFPFAWMNVVVTLLWLVGITNAFNLLDNMDGLSAGVALMGCAVLLINAWSLGEFFISLLLLAFMGCLLGFLLFNFHPASVFMGDCGSLFIGYVLASLTLLERYVTHASSTLFPLLMPVMICAVPLLDTATVMFIRLWERRPIYVGDARHLSHRLVSMGFPQRTAVLLLYLLTFSLGLGAASLTHAAPGQSFLVLLQSLGFVTLVLSLMFVERRRQPREPA
jgi:UDP-GlcNAc:undecaprenyl-phosphate GlcNAc-1-phosphate transferase